MTAVPPSVVYSVSSPSSASPHILSKYTATPTTVTHIHPQLHLDRQADRHLPPDRPADRHTDRQTERQTELLMHLDRQLERQAQTSSSSSSVAPPSGSAGSMRPCSPPLQLQTTGICLYYPRSTKLSFLVNYLLILHIKCFTGSTPGTPKLTQLPVRTPQKVKATVANIPVGSYEGGGRGKEREREKDREREREKERDREREREREKEREREAAATSHFSFDPESPSTYPTEEPPSSERPLEGSSAADSSDTRSRESTTTKEVRGMKHAGFQLEHNDKKVVVKS